MDQAAWWATVHRVAKNRIQLKRLSSTQAFIQAIHIESSIYIYIKSCIEISLLEKI